MSEPDAVFWAVVAAAAVGAALLGALLVASARGAPGRALFGELARASGLTPSESKLLWTVALRAQPDDPPAIFVKRSAFEAAAPAAAPDAEALELLRRKVYGP